MKTELENLRIVLSSPRPRAPSTLSAYLLVASKYLTWLDGKMPPDEMDLRRYFLKRRDDGIGENSLRTHFAQLKKLYVANKWPWTFVKEDRPEAPTELDVPVFTRDEVIELIRNRDLYTKAERFYLAIATVYAPRRIELARIKKKDIKGNTLRIDTAKHGEKRTHLVPDEILPFIEDYRPQEHHVSSLTAMFGRICKQGLGEYKKGYGFHCFRRTLDTLLPVALAKADKPLTLVGYFMRWNRKAMGSQFLGSAMGGVYSHPEILSTDPFFVDREVFEVHPFLQLWADGDK